MHILKSLDVCVCACMCLKSNMPSRTFTPQNKKCMNFLGRVQWRATSHLWCEQELRELGCFTWWRESWGGSCQYVWIPGREIEEDESDSSQCCPVSDRTRGDGHNVKHRKFYLNITPHFFTAWVVKPGERLFRGLLSLPFNELLKIWLVIVVDKLQ